MTAPASASPPASFASASPEQTAVLAAALEPHLVAGDTLLLSGDLGAGKTVFTQGLAAALGITESVTSPTFALAATYASGRLVLHHLDAYRLDNLRELIDLDLFELVEDEALVCIEWGEVVSAELPRDFLEVSLGFVSAARPNETSPNERSVELNFVGDRWSQRASAIAADMKASIVETSPAAPADSLAAKDAR